MQNTFTGQIHPVEFTHDPAAPIQSNVQRLEAAKDKAIPNRAHQGPLFQVGEILDLKGGKFKVTRIDLGGMKLRSMPKDPA